MIDNIKHGAGTVDFSYDGVDYRVATGRLGFKSQRKLMTDVAKTANDKGEIDPSTDEFTEASEKILEHALINLGDSYAPLTPDQSEATFTKAFGDSLPDANGWESAIAHATNLALIVYQFLLDDEWMPDQSEEGDSKKKSSRKNTVNGSQKAKAKATLSTTLNQNVQT